MSRYNQSQNDRNTADHDESIFGWLTLERGWDTKEALENLAPYLREAHSDTERNVTGAKVVTAVSAVGGLLLAGSIGLAGALPLCVAGLAGLMAYQNGRCLPRREVEARLVKNHPELLHMMYGYHLKGMPLESLIASWDKVLDSVQKSGYRSFKPELIGQETSNLLESHYAVSPSVGQSSTVAHPQSVAPTELQPPLHQTVEHPQSVAPTEVQAPSRQHIVSPVWSPAQDLGENPQSALIVGVPGSGKGMLVSNAIRSLRAKHPNITIFVIDPKADPKERGYWEGLADRYCAFSLMSCPDPDEGAKWLLSCMAQFQSIAGPKLCIFDELMSASTELGLANKELKALQRLKKFVVGLIGQGDSQQAWLWAMTQSPQVADMGMSGGVRANLRAIGLVSSKNLAAVEALTSTKLIPPPPGGMDELREIMASSPVNRAVFDGKLARWLPMPKLENHSGFDRDNRTIQREPKADPSIAGTWREDFARNLPHGLSESEFKTRYELEATLREADPIEVSAVVDPRPDGLDEFPMVAIVWDYLHGKEPRTIKQITMALRKSEKISEPELKAKLGAIGSYSDGISSIVNWGTSKGFLVSHSDGSYSASTNNN